MSQYILFQEIETTTNSIPKMQLTDSRIISDVNDMIPLQIVWVIMIMFFFWLILNFGLIAIFRILHINNKLFKLLCCSAGVITIIIFSIYSFGHNLAMLSQDNWHVETRTVSNFSCNYSSDSDEHIAYYIYVDDYEERIEITESKADLLSIGSQVYIVVNDQTGYPCDFAVYPTSEYTYIGEKIQ